MNVRRTNIAAGAVAIMYCLWTGAVPALAGQDALRLTAFQTTVGEAGGKEAQVDLHLRNDGGAAAKSVSVGGEVQGKVGSVEVSATDKAWTCTVTDPDEAASKGYTKFSCQIDKVAADKRGHHLQVRINPKGMDVSVNELAVSADAQRPVPASPGELRLQVRGTPGHLAGTAHEPTSTAKPPVTTWRSVTFPITFNDVPEGDGYYIAQYFRFANRVHGESAYIGLAPITGGMMHAKFSVFGKGTKSADSGHCYETADGGDGTSCNLPDIPLVRSHRYELTVERDEKPVGNKVIWRGYVRDGSAGPAASRTQIGAWELAASDGELTAKSQSFVEYYLGGLLCENLPHVDVTIAAPKAVSLKATNTRFEQGPCKGHQHYSSEVSADGSTRIKIGRRNDCDC